MDLGTLITAMVTPFNQRRDLDLKRAVSLAEYLVGEGSEGLVIGGTTGESPSLETREKLMLFEAVLDAVGDRAHVIAGTGSNSTAGTIKLTKQAEALGVKAFMLVCPYYNKPPQDGLFEHFRAVADATAGMLMIYNVPGRTAVNLSPATAQRLGGLPNVVALKEASGNLEQISEICRSVPPGVAVYSGDDALTLPVLAVGGRGVVSVASHVVGPRIAEMCRAYRDGRVAAATALHHQLLGLFKALFVTTNPIAVKAALGIVGQDCGPCRLPLTAPETDQLAVIRKTLEELGLVS